MLASLIFSAFAGLAVSHAEPVLRRALEGALKEPVPMSEADFRLLTFIVLMAIAALLTTAFGADSSAFAALLGGALGYFGPGLWKVLRNPHDVPDGARWDGALRPPGTRPVQRPHEPKSDDETLQAVSDALQEPDVLEDPERAQRPVQGEDRNR